MSADRQIFEFGAARRTARHFNERRASNLYFPSDLSIALFRYIDFVIVSDEFIVVTDPSRSVVE